MKIKSKIKIWMINLLVTFITIKSFSQTNISTIKEDTIPVIENKFLITEFDKLITNKTSARITKQKHQFNKGNIADPALLVQGKISGLTIYNRGGNPNTPSVIRIRGINSLGALNLQIDNRRLNSKNSEPLIVIDGIVSGARLSNIDPNDIESFTIIKDAASSAIYGMRASNGIIEIKTKQARKEQPWITYSSQIGSVSAHESIKIMTAEEFLNAGGRNLGSKTDWLKTITQKGLILNHSTTIQAYKNNTGVRISANLRKVDGILKNTGFDQRNLRGNIFTGIFDDKIKINVSGSITDRNSDLGFEEAFNYALSRNPTEPIFAKDALHNASIEQYGGYQENPTLADSYNPIAMIELNKRIEQKNEMMYSGNLSYNIMNPLTLEMTYSHQSTNNNIKGLYPTTSFYKGNAAFANKKGFVEEFDFNSNFYFFDMNMNYEKKIRRNQIRFKAGYAYQNNYEILRKTTLADFDKDVNFDNFIKGLDLNKSKLNSTITEESPNDRIISQYALANVDFHSRYFVNASLRRDGSSRLGTVRQWGFFPALSAGIDFAQFTEKQKIEKAIFKIGIGRTGNLPHTYRMSHSLKQEISGSNGNIILQYAQGENQTLGWENTYEVNTGIEIAKEKINASIDIYTKISTDLLLQNAYDGPRFFYNVGQILTEGKEFSINYVVIKTDALKYSTEVNFSASKSRLVEYLSDNDYLPMEGLPSQGISLKRGEKIGNIIGLVFVGINNDGTPKYKDVNNDGTINQLTGFGLLNSDAIVLGNGIPDFELSFTNELSYRNWSITTLLRGAFGHSLVNYQRFYNEAISTNNGNYNYTNTSKKVIGLTKPQFSSLYVEKADFIKLDNVTVARNFSISKKNNPTSIEIYISGQNLFVVTAYTGSDPEPVLIDNGAKNFNIISTMNPLSPGLDYRNNYVPSRSILIGLKIGW